MSVDFYVDGELGESANFSNMNCRLLLAAMGLPTNDCLVGSADAADLIARIDNADISAAVTSTEVSESVRGKVRMVVNGQDKEAVIRKLASIKKVAENALTLQKKVVWA